MLLLNLMLSWDVTCPSPATNSRMWLSSKALRMMAYLPSRPCSATKAGYLPHVQSLQQICSDHFKLPDEWHPSRSFNMHDDLAACTLL